jgi:S1-C subfamily serine protease
MFVVVLALLGGVACNLSELASVTVEPVVVEKEATQPETAPVAAATAEVIIVEVTSTPPPAAPLSPVDIEEQLVTSVYARVGPAVVCVTAQQHFGECIGSGFIIDREGHIITNNHVATAAEDLLVTLADEHSVPAEIVGTDPGSDLAVLDIDVPAEELTVAELGESATLQVGQRAIAIGNPFGLERTITIGVISSLARTLPRDDSDFQLAEVIQTDAAINPGNSGGPLLNSQGQVIGVNSAIRTTSGVNMGVGFAIPVDIVKRVAPELIAQGRYRHPWLGVSGRSLSPEIVDKAQLAVENGVLIFDVVPGSPADKAGLRGGNQQVVVSGVPMLVGGDVVIAIGPVEVKRFDDVVNHLAVHTSVGDVVTLTVVREGQQIEIGVTLEERPGGP